MAGTHRYTATVEWTGNTGDGTRTYRSYERAHVISVAGKPPIPGSSDPAFRGDAGRWNPEDLLVASLSTCHMLTFLAIASRRRFTVDSYEDEAVGRMTKNHAGKLWVSHVILRPRVAFSGERKPTKDEMADMHHLAHENCFIALSVKTDVTVEHG